MNEKNYFEEMGKIPNLDNKANEEMQQALRSEDTFEEPIAKENREIFEKLKLGAVNVIKCFDLKRSPDNKKGENLVVVADAGVDKLMLRALNEVGREIAGNDCRIVVVPETEHAAQSFGETVGEKMKTADAVLLLTSFSRSHSAESREVYHPVHSKEIIEQLLNSPKLKNDFSNIRDYNSDEITERISERKLRKSSEFPSKARVISITNTRTETLTEGGALEDPNDMKKRIEKFDKTMEGVEKVRITSDLGTDLTVKLKKGTLMKESGIINEPGRVQNFPSGEYCYSVDIPETNGVYVVDGAVGMIGRVDSPIKITIENGVAVKIEGGESAEKIKKILEDNEKDYKSKNPEDINASAFKIAEFSFGMNSKAFAYNEKGEKISPVTSLEGEKGLGTIHIALGKNSLFNVHKEDPDYNNVSIHIDFVAMKPEVIGIDKDGNEKQLLKNRELFFEN
jgi:hypothetical protein